MGSHCTGIHTIISCAQRVLFMKVWRVRKKNKQGNKNLITRMQSHWDRLRRPIQNMNKDKKDSNTFSFRLLPQFPKDKVYKNINYHSIEPKKLFLQQTMRLRSSTVRSSQPWAAITYASIRFPKSREYLPNGALFQDIRPLSKLHQQKRWTQNTWAVLSFSNYLC